MLRASLPYFGSVGLWRAAAAQGGFAFRQNEHYQRRSQRNRTVVATSRGRHLLSVPLLTGKHERCPVTEVRISYAVDWPRTHYLTLRSAYGSAPMWAEAAGELEALYARRPERLWDWNLACCTWARDWVAPGLVLATADDWRPGTDDAPAPSLDVDDGLPPYPQVFAERTGWLGNLSIVDLLLCRGPAASRYLVAP